MVNCRCHINIAKRPFLLKSIFYILQTLVDSAVLGVVVGISIAFPILTFTTLNIAIGLLATLCIGMVTTIVVGIIPLAGWKLGVSLSISERLNSPF